MINENAPKAINETPTMKLIYGNRLLKPMVKIIEPTNPKKQQNQYHQYIYDYSAKNSE